MFVLIILILVATISFLGNIYITNVAMIYFLKTLGLDAIILLIYIQPIRWKKINLVSVTAFIQIKNLNNNFPVNLKNLSCIFKDYLS